MDRTGSTLIIVFGNPEGHVPLTDKMCDCMKRIWKIFSTESLKVYYRGNITST
jgi:hypothetical protein